jgi:hypothetical protein
MRSLSTLAAAATIALALLSAGEAHAGMPDGLSYFVSPPGCVPKTDDDAERLRLNNGVWIFRDGEEDAADLLCPLDFYGNIGSFNNMQLWYIDEFDEDPPSGFAHNGHVQATLMRRDRVASGAIQVAWNDSNLGPLGHNFVNKFDVPGGPTTGKAYYLEVLLYRESDTAHVGFAGVAFDLD